MPDTYLVSLCQGHRDPGNCHIMRFLITFALVGEMLMCSWTQLKYLILLTELSPLNL